MEERGHVALHHKSNYYIDMDVKVEDGFIMEADGDLWWTLGKSQVQNVEMMRYLHAQEDLPWLYACDFNNITFAYEKESGRPDPKRARTGSKQL